MFIDNSELVKDWKIDCVGCFYFQGIRTARVEYEVTFPGCETVFIRLDFSMRFINEYFSISGSENSKKIAEKNEWLLKKWGLVRIKECINTDFMKPIGLIKIEITHMDLEWARKIGRD